MHIKNKLNSSIILDKKMHKYGMEIKETYKKYNKKLKWHFIKIYKIQNQK
jgi:hypothetical protein